MSNATNLTSDVPVNGTAPVPPSYPACSGTFNPFDCNDGTVVDEDRYLAILILALGTIACALCCITCILTVLVHKLSTIWVKSMMRSVATTEPSDDPRKGADVTRVHPPEAAVAASGGTDGGAAKAGEPVGRI